jgi:hypothetical protein
MAEIQTIYQVWCDICGGQVYRSMDSEGANQALAMHEETHQKAAVCDHPAEARVYGVGEQPAETCTVCGYSFPMNQPQGDPESMIPTVEPATEGA